MGWHTVWDDADVALCKYLISQIEDHMNNLLNEARHVRRNNRDRVRRRREDPDAEVSDDETVCSDDAFLSDHTSDEEDEEEEDKEEE